MANPLPKRHLLAYLQGCWTTYKPWTLSSRCLKKPIDLAYSLTSTRSFTPCHRALENREILLTRTKGGRPRIVPLSERAVGTVKDPSSPYVFRHNTRDRYLNFAARFIALRKKANAALTQGKIEGVPVNFRCHDLRHKFAIDSLKNGGDTYKLSRIMGHTSVKTTEIYLNYVGTKTGSGITVSHRLQSKN